MTTYDATAATGATYHLGEGIIWDDRHGLVRWVDIDAGRVHAGRLQGGRIVDISSIELGQTAGAVALAEDGGLLLAASRGLATVSPDGEISLGPDLLGDRNDVRFNDAAVDPQGRFVVGTLSLSDPTGDEVLLRVSATGQVEVLRDGIQLSNGVAFSPDGDTIYHVDTFAGTVARHSYGAGPFDSSEPWVTVLDDFAHYPDGMTVDATGALWIAQWGGFAAHRYAPTGELLDAVTVDAEQASCPAFVGPELTTLGITTAQEGLTEFTDQAGAIFLAQIDAAGLSTPRWAGSTTAPYWTLQEEKENA